MKKKIVGIFLLIFGLFSAFSAEGQKLQVLPTDPAVKVSVLPNGMSCYIVTNPVSKGVADFALIQKVGTATTDDDSLPVTVARQTLDSLKRLGNLMPQRFIAAKGVAPGSIGYVDVSEDATIFRFKDVMLSKNAEILDSTLLFLVDISDRGTDTDDDFVRKWYTPADQAVVVSGDVNAASVLEKLRMMSMMVPSRKSAERGRYMWEDSSPCYEVKEDSQRGIAEVSLAWRFPRPPMEYMNTVQPVIYRLAVYSLGEIALRRMKVSLQEKGIAVADARYSYADASVSSGDETFSITLSLAPEALRAAVETMAGVLASIDAEGVSHDEFVVARQTFIQKLSGDASDHITGNDEYVDRCISAFLYNSSLASPKEVSAYLSSRNLDPRTELQLFNSITSAFLDETANLVLRCDGHLGGLGSEDLESIFTEAWRSGKAGKYIRSSAVNRNDTLAFPGYGPKVKLKTSRTDFMSGGFIWEFSNGFKVLYRKMNTGGKMYYSLGMNGGYGSVDDLSAGEGAYMSDYPLLCHISGLKGRNYHDMLLTEGISMDIKVGLSSTVVSGTAAKGRTNLLMKSLLALVNERTPDPEAFAMYRKDMDLYPELIRGSRVARMTAIDSIMCPGYRYSLFKASGRITDSFAEKADRFFSAQTEKMNDGVLVLVGDVDEVRLRKLLQMYVGGFRTSERAFKRVSVRYQPLSGWSTHTVSGSRNSVDLVMSAPLALTADNYMSAAIAAMVLEQALAEVLADTGMYLTMSYDYSIYPVERFNIMISLNEASVDGFAAGLVHAGPVEALARLRSAVSDLSSIKIPKTEMNAYKAYLKAYMAQKMTTPSYWAKAMTMRYLDGKDFTTGYQAKVDAVTEAKVRAVLSALDKGSKVEYIVKE